MKEKETVCGMLVWQVSCTVDKCAREHEMGKPEYVTSGTDLTNEAAWN